MASSFLLFYTGFVLHIASGIASGYVHPNNNIRCAQYKKTSNSILI